MKTRQISLRTLTIIAFSTIATIALAFAFAGLPFSGSSKAEAAGASGSQAAPLGGGGPGVCDVAGAPAIEVHATAGTTTPTGYPTLTDAFAAINLGTHQGVISIDVCGNTTEAASASLDSSGTGTTSYTSVLIRPVGTARIIEGTITGAVIKLNGADNVTIDGRIGGTGNARSLTVRNNAAVTATAAIWLASVAAGNGASNNVIRNLEVAAGQTANTGTLVTVGIIQTGTTISLTSTSGNDNDNNQFIFNRVTRARYGIASRGVTTNNNEAPIVTDNIVGPSSFGEDEIGKVGIYMQADTGAIVSRNTVQFVGGDATNTTSGSDRCGICIGNENWGQTEASTITSGDYTVTRNVVHDIVEERTFSAVGIRLGTTRGGSATNNLVANNFVYNVRTNGTAGDQACGIGYAAGHTDRIVNNSIAMTGDMDPATATASGSIYGNGIRVSTINGTNNVNLALMDNSIYMDANANNPALHYYAITLPSAAYAFGTGGLNYNNYYVRPGNAQLRVGGLGTTSGVTPGTEFAGLFEWKTALTVPQDANSIQGNPAYFDPTSNLHVNPMVPSALENTGTPIAGITDDIDGDMRNATTPDIGADEFTGVPLPANDIGATAILVPAPNSLLANGATPTPQASFTNLGLATQTNVSVQFTITGPGGFNYSDMQSIASIANGQTVTVSFAPTAALTADGVYTMAATILTADADAGNNSVNGSFRVVSALSGSVNVGSAGAFTSLTNPGGIFDAMNVAGVSAPMTINITSDLMSETGAVLLNEIAGGHAVTIKPSGGARQISGTSSTTSGLVGFAGADNITIDGSLSGGSDRSLTITSGNTAATGGGIYFASGAAGAQGNTVKNVKVVGNGATTGVLLGIAFAGTTFGGLGVDNDNNRIENNEISGAFYGIAHLGASAANKDANTVITRNVMPGIGAAGIARVGIYVIFNDSGQITQNTIASVATTSSVDCIGIAVGSQGLGTTAPATGGISNATVAQNVIGVVSNTSTFSSAGIVLSGDTSGTNTVANNVITGVVGNGNTGDIVAGIYVAPFAGGTQNIYHNSVSMTGDRLPVTANMFPSYALAIASDQPVNVLNNVLLNSQTRTGSTGGGGESYAIGFDGVAANVNLTSNNNDLFVSGPLGVIGITGDLTTTAQTTTAGTGVNRLTLADWQTATMDDAASISADPLFASATDLHIAAGSPVRNLGAAGTGITVDFEGQARDGTPDSGADEFGSPGVLEFSAPTYMVGEAGPVATITVNRTGGTAGAVSVNYSLADGTATGGAACGGSVDYVNTGGTVNFADGQASNMFTVPICDDATVELSETFTASLSGATGGAAIGAQSSATVTITDNDVAGGAVTVTASGGTPSGTYTNLTETVAAINAGTHQGDIVVNVNQSFVEPGTVVLNGSGSGTAIYTSVLIRPTQDSVSITGPSAQGRGLIELNGADNVTIDGDNPNTGGIARNLTIQNTAANTTTFTSVIRVALNTTTVNSADNNTFKNLNILGSSTGQNVAGSTSTTISANTTFGIFLGPNASGPTTAPNAITSVTTGVAAGATATNLTISNNSVDTAARAISMNGSATTVLPGLQVVDNTVGHATAGDADQVTAIGITVQGSTNAVIAGNTVYVEGYIASSAAGHGINVGVNSVNVTGATIERNQVRRVRNNNPETWSAFGINLGGGSSHVVRNNFVSGIINSQTAGTGGFGTTFGAYGIRVSSGTGHAVLHNSVHLYDPLPGTTSTDLTAAFMIVNATQTGMDVRNNIFSNQVAGGNPTGTRNVAVYLPTATVTMNLTLNNNAYYVGSDALNRLAQRGTAFGTGEFTVADFDPNTTTPASNFRAYTSTLSAAGTNDNASFAITGVPAFVSNVDLHIPNMTVTPLESRGAAVAVGFDIDGQMRNATTPDIGADEFSGVFVTDFLPPSMTYSPFGNTATVANRVLSVTIVDASGVPTAGSLVPRIYFNKNGGAYASTPCSLTGGTGMNGTWDCTINYALIGGVMTGDVIRYFVISQDTATPINIGSNPGGASATDVNTVTSPPPSPNAYSIVAAIPAAVSVGVGETFTSLTNPGGIFEAINNGVLIGNTTINITSDLTAETGAVPLNQFIEDGVGGFSLTIKPSGAPRVISGTAPVNFGLIKLNGADRVTIDGSLAGGTDKSLTITNMQTGLTTVIWIASAGASNGANNNTVKNTIINGVLGATQTTAGVLAGSGATLGNAGEAPNNNNTVANNLIYNVQNSIFSSGNAALLDQNWIVTGNTFGSATPGQQNTFRGMLMGGSQNFLIAGNEVAGVSSTPTTGAAMSGIQLSANDTGGVVVGNRITNIRNNSATGTGAFGMQLGNTAGSSNNLIANNFISDVRANGSATVNNNGHGITINGAAPAGTYKIYFNSINLNTDQASGTTAAINVTTAVVAAGALDIRNNILANTQTGGATRFSVFSAAAAAVFGNINYNDYFSTQNVGSLGGVRVTLADWQTATGQDANSLAVNPLFVSPTDLHLQGASPMINAGLAGLGVTTDIDGDTRGAQPDIGADEVVAAVPAQLAGQVLTSTGAGIRNVIVTITCSCLAQPQRVYTSSFGYYHFDNLLTGNVYTVSVASKRFTFAVPSQQVTLNGNVDNINFTANPQ